MMSTNIQQLTFRSRRNIVCLLSVWLAFSGHGQGHAAKVYVSVDGHAQADGSLARWQQGYENAKWDIILLEGK